MKPWMTPRDIDRLRGAAPPSTHLARYDRAFRRRALCVLEELCPDCGAARGQECSRLEPKGLLGSIPGWHFTCPCGAHLHVHANSAEHANAEALDHGWLLLHEGAPGELSIFACSKTCREADARGNR